jgi:hypothetical protein
MDWAFRGSNQAAGLDRTGGRLLGLTQGRSVCTSVDTGRTGTGSPGLAQERSGAHFGGRRRCSLRWAPPIGDFIANRFVEQGGTSSGSNAGARQDSSLDFSVGFSLKVVFERHDWCLGAGLVTATSLLTRRAKAQS